MAPGKKTATPQGATRQQAASAAGTLIALLTIAGAAYVIYRFGDRDVGGASDDPIIRAVDAQRNELSCTAEVLSGMPRSPDCQPSAAQQQEEKAK